MAVWEAKTAPRYSSAVVLDGALDHGEGAGAGGALEVFKDEDGDPGSGGRLEHGGVFEGGAGVGGR